MNKYCRIWMIVDAFNEGIISFKEIEDFDLRCFQFIDSLFIDLRKDIFNKLELNKEDLEEEYLLYLYEKISDFIFEGRESVENNINKDGDKLESYILETKSLGFDAMGFFKGISLISRLKKYTDDVEIVDSSEDKENTYIQSTYIKGWS